MKTTVKTYWICMLLMLAYSVSSYAVDFTKVDGQVAEACNTSATLSSSSSDSYVIDNANSSFDNVKFMWSSDLEMGVKPITEVYSSNQQRLRRVLEVNPFLRSIILILSNHENLLVQGQTKLYDSIKSPHYALMGSDYYIFTLRRILI